VVAFIDVTCPHCGKRFGWRGEVDGPAPPCPACGKDLGEDVEKEKPLAPQTMTAEGFFKARRAAGVSFGQAANHLRLSDRQLEAIEEGLAPPSKAAVKRMENLYRMEFTDG